MLDTIEPKAAPIYPYEDKILLVLTLIIGAVVGLVVVAFILLTENWSAKLYPAGGAAWRRLVLPVVGSVSTGLLLFRYFPNARGSGIPQTKTALYVRDGYISMRTVLGKFWLCAASLASGVALGREGPSVQVAGGIASVLGRRLGLSTASVKALVPVGASAAIAAAFNTPIAAVLFTLEEVMGDMHAPVLGSIVLGSATSWIVLHLLLGDEPLFHVPAYQLVHPIEFLCYAVLGVAGGLISVAFVKLLLWQRRKFLAMPQWSQWFLPGVGGLTVGLLGWYFPGVLGVGYNFVGEALNGQMVLKTMALLAIFKVIATATCYASGNAGGIFGPALFMGAMTGGAVGGVAHLLLPDYTGSVGAYALVGMGAAFAGIIRVPLTSVIMVFEITRDYSIIVPLMIANLISYFISSRLQEEPIYEALLEQDGIRLPSGAKAREQLLMVGNALRRPSIVFDANQTVSQAVAAQDDLGAWPVMDAIGLRGMVTAQMLEMAMDTGRGWEPLGELVPDPGPVEEITEARFPHVHADHLLDEALRRMAASSLDVLPVVSRTNVRDLKAVVSLKDILAAYGIGKAPGPWGTQAVTPAAKTPRPQTRLLAGVVTVMVALAMLIAFLNYSYRAERTTRADNFFKAGNEYMAKDRYEEAIEQYRDALSISHSLENRMALAEALTQAHSWDEAKIYWNEVLREQPSSGPANLGLARVLAAQGDTANAVTHYQRAIYGMWPDQLEQHRVAARIELIQTLEKAGRRTEAQAELMTLVANSPTDVTVRKQIAQMCADLGLYKQAADLYSEVARKDDHDAAAFHGLGDAEFAQGDYNAALAAYRDAVKVNAADATAGQKAELCQRILDLDPTLRSLSARERFERSRDLLSQTVAELTACASAPAALPDDVKADVQAAQTTLAHTARPGSWNEAEEANLAAVEKLWPERSKVCGAGPSADDPLGYVVTKLQRR
ncbi:MAG TPA: chloride channel protein [Bryobacteraceae bacterium]|nr:chloride channel protein [Bryobacteraceae bacterium]